MANTLTSFIDKLLAQGVLALRQNCTITRLVNSSYQVQTGSRGSVIEVPIPSALAANAVTPGPTVSATQDMAPTTALVPMDQWREVPFTFTDQEVHQVSAGIFPSQASEAIKTLSAEVASHIYGKYVETPNWAGDISAVAFGGTTGTAHARALRKTLTQQLAPASDRFAVISPDVTEAAMGVEAFALANQSGSARGITEGEIGRKFGFNWSEDQLMPVHVGGTEGGTGTDTVVNGAHLAGVSTINLTVGATNGLDLKVGDIITFGTSRTYAVTTAVTAAATAAAAVAITPVLAVGLAGTEVAAVVGDDGSGGGTSYEVNIGAHRDAFAFASVQATEMDLNKLLGVGSSVNAGVNGVDRQVTDPVTRMSLRLVIERQHYQYRLAFSMLYGASIPRPELACRLLSVAP